MVELDYTHHLLFAAPGTAEAVRTGKKDVTRRLVKDADQPCRWRSQAWSRCYERSPRAGGEPFGSIWIQSIRRELLGQIDHEDVRREGARAISPAEFDRLFRDIHGLPADADPLVWRIEFADFTPVAT